MKEQLPKYKMDSKEIQMILWGAIPNVAGLTLCTVAFFTSQLSRGSLIFALGMLWFGFGCGVFVGAGMMRQALLKHLEKEGAIKLEGKRGKEQMSFIPIDKADKHD